LDDADVLEQAKEDPKGLLSDDQPTIIDEVERCPDLLLTVKYFVDKSNRRRKFILSGSGNISLRQTPRETLAGRAKYLHLTGFALRELNKTKSWIEHLADRVSEFAGHPHFVSLHVFWFVAWMVAFLGVVKPA